MTSGKESHNHAEATGRASFLILGRRDPLEEEMAMYKIILAGESLERKSDELVNQLKKG